MAREFQPQRDEAFHFAFETFYREIRGASISTSNTNDGSSSLVLAQICINLIKASMPTGELFDSGIWMMPVFSNSKFSMLLDTLRNLANYTKDLPLSQVSLSSSLSPFLASLSSLS